MYKYDKSVLDNIIFFNIEKLKDDNHNIYKLKALKTKDGIFSTYSDVMEITNIDFHLSYESDIKASLEEIKRAHNKINSLESLNTFIENLPIICNKASFTKMMFLNLSPSKNIEVLDFLEFVAILEPWKKEYSLDILMHEITNIYEAKEGENLDECTKLMVCVNSILLRQWEREESNGSKKKKKSMFTILALDYGLKNRWNWTKYLEKPLMFTYEDYDYVNYEDNKVIKPNLKKIKISYDENEDLLKRSEIWNNGNDFVYQYRESQRNFAGKIRENIEKEEKIFIEAPTGSGKTFAYVLIAALKAYKNKDTHKNEDASFIISTDTKELQSQLIQRDIPSILHKLNLEDKLNYGAIKGKGNYICVDRLSKYSNFDTSIYGVLAEVFLKRLCKDGLYGDIENINYWSYNHFSLGDYISDIVCDNEECNIEKCHRKCLLKKRYNELPSENITVVNHSLLASWPYSEKKKITHLIIDEAHNLMDKCYDFFSEEFSSYDFTESLKNLYEKEPTIYRQFTNLNAQNGMRESIELEKIKYWVKEIETYMSILLNKAIELKLAGGDYSFKCEFNLPPINLKSKIDSLRPFISNVKERIYGLYSLLNRYFNNITLEGEEGKDDREYIKINNYLTKLKEAFNTIDAFLEDDNKRKTAKTLEISNNYSYFRLTNTPLNIDEMFNEHILKDVKSTTFLSATMRINNSFNTIKYTLGQRDASELTVPKTFDLKRKTKIFVMNDIGRYNSLEFPKNSAEFIFNVSQKLNGHIMVLFTNNLRRKKVEEELLELTKNTAFEVHTHKKSIKYLNDKKRKVIILGSKGFFEGIDVPGDALTCVILDKIPNKNLEEPLLKAITTYKNRTYNDVNYPEICIKLKQVYGRLIRSVNDYGYFCIMDGGENLNVLRRLERDMSGPDFIFSNQKNLLASMNRDYYRWQTDNLRKIISSSNKESSFHDEARKMKSFWTEEENTNGLKVFKNGMFKINSKK